MQWQCCDDRAATIVIRHITLYRLHTRQHTALSLVNNILFEVFLILSSVPQPIPSHLLIATPAILHIHEYVWQWINIVIIVFGVRTGALSVLVMLKIRASHSFSYKAFVKLGHWWKNRISAKNVEILITFSFSTTYLLYSILILSYLSYTMFNCLNKFFLL